MTARNGLVFWVVASIGALAMFMGLMTAVVMGQDATDTPQPTPNPYLNMNDDLRNLAQAYDSWLASGQPESAFYFPLDWVGAVDIHMESNEDAIIAFLNNEGVTHTEGWTEETESATQRLGCPFH